MPDYLLIFKKEGINEIPVTHPFGLTNYAGDYPLLIAHLGKYGISDKIESCLMPDGKNKSMTLGVEDYIKKSFAALKEKYKHHKDPKTNKLSHIIWQRYASSVWDDIRIDNVLPFRESKDQDDEKHVHPLQLDVVDRVVELYSNPDEVVLTPFMGVGTEVYSPVSMGRKAIGIELKDSYFVQTERNMETVNDRFREQEEETLFQ